MAERQTRAPAWQKEPAREPAQFVGWELTGGFEDVYARAANLLHGCVQAM